MPRPTRRTFLKTASVGALVTIAGTKSSPRVLGASDRIRVAIAGLNGRGGSHVSEFSGMTGVEIAYLVDPDKRTYARKLKTLADKKAPTPKCVQDVREALQDKNVDVLTIAAPNHWHALMTVWGCQAGKDVYVEKPVSHNVFEGRIAVEAARKFNRIVQHGTQSRSSGQFAALAELAKSGKYGKLLISRGLVYKPGTPGRENTRTDIGFKPVKAPPSELDFNLWTGPAPKQDYHENLVHYRWHWFWDFGNGDIGNQGVHQMDIARWMIPGATLPKSVFSLGGRIGHKDQGQTASTQVSVFDYGETQLIFEVRGYKSKPFMGQETGNMLHFEAGTVSGNKFYPKNGGAAEDLPRPEGRRGGRPVPGADRGESGHFGNFIAAVRSRQVQDLKADVEVGHLSCALIHLANASQRLGQQVPFSKGAASLNGNKDAADAVARMEEHLAKDANLKLEDWPLTVGPKLMVDAGTGMVVNNDSANKLLTREYRAPFVVPAKL